MNYNFAVNQKDDAEMLILKYHYSHKIPANTIYHFTLHEDGGLFGDMGKPIAACLFGFPACQWKEEVFELTRLVRIENINIQLSGFISICTKFLKHNNIDLLVSYADETQNHKGYIYQACSWNYHGLRKRALIGLIINGIEVHGRSCNTKYGTRSAEKLKIIHPEWKIEPLYDIGKHLYWKALNKKGKRKAKKLRLEKNEYPKG